jgi:SpoVK/Ycf46/Vps4 family AAA+-type ATPase
MDIFHIHTSGTRLSLSDNEWKVLLKKTDGYSGCDLANLISSALLEPMRDMVKATHWATTCSKYCTRAVVASTIQFQPPKVEAAMFLQHISILQNYMV